MTDRVDVFVRCAAFNHMRHYLAAAVLDRLGHYPMARVRPLVCEGSIAPEEIPEPAAGATLPASDFWNECRVWADSYARSDVYIVIDDDHLPLGPGWIERGVDAMERHDGFAILSSISINGEVSHVIEEESRVPVFDVECCGTPYFARRGSLGKLLPRGIPIELADLVMSKNLRGWGHRIGFMRHVRHNHLGYGYSEAIPDWWNHPGPEFKSEVRS